MEGSFRLGRLAGIEVSVHASWLIAFGVLTLFLVQSFADLFPRWPALTLWVTAAVGALLLFGCVLAHELSHSLLARARGMAVGGITLFVFGGVTNLHSEAERPDDEFWMALVGPLTSFALAAVAWLLVHWVAAPCVALFGAVANRGCTPTGALLAYLAQANLLLGVFNLIPGFPLDGGRVLRAVLWGTLRDLRRATRIAVRLGQGVAYLFILLGILVSLRGGLELLAHGLWLALIGWFLLNAAESSERQALARWAGTAPPDGRIGGRGPTVGQAMRPPVFVPAEATVGEALTLILPAHGARAALVLDRGRLVGLVSLRDLQRVPPLWWNTTPVRQVAVPAEALVAVTPDTPLQEAVALLAARDLNQVPVLRDGVPVGLLTRADVLRYLAR
jgi:Zn-dependent protease